MVVGTLEQQAAPHAHIRPFDPAYDLDGLATLIGVAFGPELSATGSQMVRDLRQMALWGPMLWLGGSATSSLKGYVWIEEGSLAGNITVSPEPSRAGAWVISNVAVLPEYRGRGIAGQLLDTALGHIRSRGGRRVFLQVRNDNTVAISLYRHRGFRTFDTLSELDLPRHGWPLSIGAPMRALRSVSRSDQRRLYSLFLASTSQDVLRQQPVVEKQFRRGLAWRLQQIEHLLTQGSQCRELVAVEGDTLVAYGSLTVYLSRGPYEIDLRVLPQRRGSWEVVLIEELLRLGEGYPRQRVRAYAPISHPEAIDAYHKLGFRTLRVLDQMVLELPPCS